MSNLDDFFMRALLVFILLFCIGSCAGLSVAFYQSLKDSRECYRQTGFYSCTLTKNHQMRIEVK